jgi:hypothetical protein
VRGELPEHRDGLAGLRGQRQQPVVLQQHRSLPGGGPGQRVVRVAVDGGVGSRVRERPVDQPQHPGHRDVEHGLVELTGAHRVDERLVAPAELRRHLQVQPGPHRGDPVVHGAPVGDDHTLEAPLVAQHGGQQPRVLRHVGAVEPVVGAHHRPRLRLRHYPLEGGEVDLAQRPLVDVGADPDPVGLLVVRGVVLQRGADTLALHTLHERGAEDAGEVRVLGEVLEVAAAQR